MSSSAAQKIQPQSIRMAQPPGAPPPHGSVRSADAATAEAATRPLLTVAASPQITGAPFARGESAQSSMPAPVVTGSYFGRFATTIVLMAAVVAVTYVMFMVKTML